MSHLKPPCQTHDKRIYVKIIPTDFLTL